MTAGKIKLENVEKPGASTGDFPIFDANGALMPGGVSGQTGNDLTGFKVWKGSSTEYAALAGSYDSNTLYLVT